MVADTFGDSLIGASIRYWNQVSRKGFARRKYKSLFSKNFKICFCRPVM